MAMNELQTCQLTETKVQKNNNNNSNNNNNLLLNLDQDILTVKTKILKLSRIC